MSRRHVQRDRRRTERALDEAFAALENDEPLLAMRIGRRAREAGCMNPRILLDFATLAVACGEPREAEETLRVLLATTPGFAAAHAALADLLWRAGRHRAALHEQQRAVAAAPDDELAAARLQDWRGQVELPPPEADPAEPPPPPSARLLAGDAAALGDEFAAAGAARVARFCTPEECDRLLAACAAAAPEFDREDRFAAGVRGRYCRELPEWLAGLRAEAYRLAAEVAAHARGKLVVARHADGGGVVAAGARPAPWPKGDLPATLAGWRAREPQFASPRPMVRVVQCEPGGCLPGSPFVDRRSFPLRMVVDLGPEDAPATTLTLADHRPGRKVRQRAFQTRRGDALLFAARERLDKVGGVYGLQAVRWSLGPCASARWLLDLPFDDG